MNPHPASEPPAARGEQHNYVRLHGRWPLVLRVVWLVALALALDATRAIFPAYLAQLRTPCTTPTCPYQQLTPAQFVLLGEIGVTSGVYVVITVAVALIAPVVCWALSALIIWRRPDDWMAALVALMLIQSGPLPIVVDFPNGGLPWSPWSHPSVFVLTGQDIVVAAVFCLFPSGRFAPRWTRWALVGITLVTFITKFVPQGLMGGDTAIGKVGFVIAIIQYITLAVAQTVRYRTVSTPVQRQQTKWVVIGLITPIAYFIAMSVGLLLFPAFFTRNPVGLLVYNENDFLLPLFLALGFALAMLRYRLWEIDTLINRALVYGALSLILTALYAGLVIGLQTLARGFIGQNNSLAIVVSTLVIAALILPLRRWLQALIDRQFYRHKYDAAAALEEFGATLRHEIYVDVLREQLLQVVDETMQPAHASLWLRPTPPENHSGAHEPVHT
jgi:hypothetical protein